MAVTTIIAPGVVPAGTFSNAANPVSIGASPDARTLHLQLQSNDWLTGEAGLVVDFQIDTSTDGGATFQTQVIGRAQGGDVSSRTGALPSVSVGIPPGTALLLRASATTSQRAKSLGLGYEVTTP